MFSETQLIELCVAVCSRDDITLLSTDNAFVNTLVLNVNPTEDQRTPLRDLFANRDFRRAIALAINRKSSSECPERSRQNLSSGSSALPRQSTTIK